MWKGDSETGILGTVAFDGDPAPGLGGGVRLGPSFPSQPPFVSASGSVVFTNSAGGRTLWKASRGKPLERLATFADLGFAPEDPVSAFSQNENDVVAGPLGFAVWIFLILAVVVLAFSLVKQLRKAQAAKDAGVYGDEPVDHDTEDHAEDR